MTADPDALAALHRHLQSVFDSDLETYHATTTEDLTLYEWFVTPHRIDGVPFHDFMMTEAARPDTTGQALDPSAGAGSEKPRTRYDLANLRGQQYGDTAIFSYTMLLSQGASAGVRVRSYNESRVLIKFDEGWKVVHGHKAPAWNAPFQPPSQT
mgnify:CR=1 FL=1